jgi:mono/diheme cytochrome c family protein
MKTIFLGAALVLMPGLGFADRIDFGEKEFLSVCAVCHGIKGDGSGSFAKRLSKKPSDLTVLSKNNSGIFPVDRIYQVIDGREMAEDGHGPRDMPIWGSRFNAEVFENPNDYRQLYFSEAMVQERILALIDYLNSIQKK